MLVNQVNVNFDNVREILELSAQKLVLFYFGVEQHEACMQLLPALETICGEYPDHLILAKVDCNTEQQLAQQFGVRSLPTVMFIQQGQPVDGFAGVETAAQIQARLQPYLPKAEDMLLQQVEPLWQAQAWADIYPILIQAQQLAPERVDIRLQLAFCAASLGQISQAEQLCSTVKLADQHGLYPQVLALIELARQAADSPEIRALEAQLQQEPTNLSLQQQLAVQYHQAQRSEEALALLFGILQQDLNFDGAKKLLMDILAVLPKGDPVAGVYRRKLYSLLY